MPRFAAIDVGSNATRLSMVDLSPIGSLRDTTYFRWAVRLGADTFSRGTIDERRQCRLIEAFCEIRSLMEAQGVTAYAAVATAAMRDAADGERLAVRIRRETGIELEVISGGRESRLSRDALVRALGTVPPDTVFVDLGGGSVELHPAGARRGRSLPLGTVRLVERHPELSRAVTGPRLAALAALIERQLARHLPRSHARLAVGTGGNLDVLSQLSPARCGLYPGIDLKRLMAVARRVAAVSPSERVMRYGLRPDRADVIVPAALIIMAIRARFALERFVVPGTGIRESLLLNLAATHERMGRPRTRFGKLVLRLFDLLAPIHRLWIPALRPLLAAASLAADIDPLALSLRLAQLPLDEPSRRAAASAIAHAAGADASLYDSDLDEPDRRVGEVLGGILRLAHHLDARAARELQIDVTATPTVLTVGARMPPALRRQVQGLLGAKLCFR